MTKLNDQSSPVRRETLTLYRRRAIMVELGPMTMSLRLKGTRKGFELDYESALELAMKKEARRVEQEKGKVRKFKRASVAFGGRV